MENLSQQLCLGQLFQRFQTAVSELSTAFHAENKAAGPKPMCQQEEQSVALTMAKQQLGLQEGSREAALSWCEAN